MSLEFYSQRLISERASGKEERCRPPEGRQQQDQRADEEQRGLTRRADCLTACETKQMVLVLVWPTREDSTIKHIDKGIFKVGFFTKVKLTNIYLQQPFNPELVKIFPFPSFQSQELERVTIFLMFDSFSFKVLIIVFYFESPTQLVLSFILSLF